MAFTKLDVVNKAKLLGQLNTSDTALMERTDTTAEMVIAKTDAYIGYSSLDVDALLNILAEITVTQISRYQALQADSKVTKRITRGDYTVEYDTNLETDVFKDFEWLLKKYKKLRSL